MRLYDTRTRKRVALTLPRTVRAYACGVTPYDSTHLGHAFTYVTFDVLVRYLEHLGHQVRYVRNITDVDDDILRKAREISLDYRELGDREVKRFHRDLAGLGARVPDAEPRATGTIPAIRTAIQGLIAAGSAYSLPDGRVYFDTTAAGEDWGALSRLDDAEMLRQSAEKGGDPEAPGKRSKLDFLLWQPSAPDEPSWPSDWGDGRPGWHIECSTMAMEELGSVIDIHGGGSDLVFPHHEAEILQAEYLTGQRPFARVWFHAGMVALDGAKMSKSLGNLVFVSDLLERYEGEAIRRYLLEHHYRTNWEYDDGALAQAGAAWKAWGNAIGNDDEVPGLADEFHAAMHDDLDTPRAIDVIDRAAIVGAGGTVRRLARVLGFRLVHPARGKSAP